ncbi:MAG: flagellar export protein FliJ [Clostridiales bacterium]|uniref:flagellar export protein FliJ n=1 Tax=Roseburia sp. MSJ-14 TaxID=2841514 RepID=UPI0016A42FA4|nr:flagellar export protein FliJ [Roseburia sp. MSJ-14]MBU5472928.1 flagellar export protein FliJ [Roseburia sp. MSJ-14]NLK78372.1 flagellar export protein FliJ [Clostridiales bacterium]
MAKFIYRMQNILDVKYKLETQAKTSFSIAAANLNKEEEKLAELNLRKLSYEEEARELVKDRLNFQAIKVNRAAIENMKGAIRSQTLAVHIAQRNLESARKHLQEVMIERKTHEKLKEKAFDEFKKEIEKEESKAVDELVSFTHNHAENK